MTHFSRFLDRPCLEGRTMSRRYATVSFPLAWFTLAAAVSLYQAAALGQGFDLLDSGTATHDQGQTFDLLISGTNSSGEAIDVLSVLMGLQWVAEGSATGSLELIDVAGPAGSFWLDPASVGPTAASLANGSLNGTSSYTSFGINDNGIDGMFGTINPGDRVDLVRLTFQASNDALGIWRFFVVNEEDEGGITVANLVKGDFSSMQFANVTAPSYSATPNTGVSFQVGKVVIVPEHSTFVLAGLGVPLAAYFATWNRRRTA